MFSLIGNITQACCQLLWDRCKLSIVEKINNSCFCLSCGPSSLPTCDLLAPSLVFHTIACCHVSDHWPFIADASFLSVKNINTQNNKWHHACKKVIFFFFIQQQKQILPPCPPCVTIQITFHKDSLESCLSLFQTTNQINNQTTNFHQTNTNCLQTNSSS